MGDVQVEALAGVSLEIHDGELLAVVGPSGSGKSTLLNLIAGMDRPSGGTVRFREENIGTFSDSQQTDYRRERVGYVFQFYNLIPSLTALENVLISTELSRDPMSPEEALRLVELTDRGDHFPSQLSGGEQQRVAIARALAKNPELILCDEPTGALDFTTGKRVLRVLVDLNRKFNKTILIITHNSAIAKIADRVVRLRSGRITQVETNARPIPPEEVVW